jgi:hypothetical protein
MKYTVSIIVLKHWSMAMYRENASLQAIVNTFWVYQVALYSPLSPSMQHYDTFRLQLGNTHSHFGHALWDTSLEEQYPTVEVGDVGFIREGKFFRVFNALYSEHHSCNRRFGVPEDHERLSPVPNHISHATLQPTNICSHGVIATSGGSNFQAAE